MMLFPLTHWRLSADRLPDELLRVPRQSSFSLPGAAALEAFAELLGGAQGDAQDDNISEDSAAFSLPALLPDRVCGEARLSREIDFGALRGESAVLTFDHLAGRGDILLDDEAVARFDSAQITAAPIAPASALTAAPCMLTVDLTNALHLGRKRTLTIRFDDTRPAGACGPILLRTASHAHLTSVRVTPDSRNRTMTVSAQVRALREGSCTLRVQAVPPRAGLPVPNARQISAELAAGEARVMQLALEVPGDVFVPGKAYDAPALKIQLFSGKDPAGHSAVPLDDALLLCGYPAKAPRAYLPLTAKDCAGDPQALITRLAALNVSAVSLPAPAPDCVYRALDRAGISAHHFMPADDPMRALLTRHPCVSLSHTPLMTCERALEASAWQLCGPVSFPRAIDESLTPAQLLYDAFGRSLDPADKGVQSVLLWLRALSIRLRAEAARQSRYEGALCAPREAESSDIADALRTAFAPTHLSSLPLCGAWWTGMRFSATLEAFLPEDTACNAVAVLEDEEGKALARFGAPCAKSGYVGVIEATLPERPCVLELATRLEKDGVVIEESSLPVYVGERGPLEAAFT